jgi:hypothetical protein
MWLLEKFNQDDPSDYLASFSTEEAAYSALELMESQAYNDHVVYNGVIVNVTDCNVVRVPEWEDKLLLKLEEVKFSVVPSL